MTLAELAEAVNVDPGDVRVVLTWLSDGGITEQDIPKDAATAVHRILNPHSSEPSQSFTSRTSILTDDDVANSLPMVIIWTLLGRETTLDRSPTTSDDS